VLVDCTREVLDAAAPRALAVLDPIKVVITTWPAGEVDMLEAPMHPKMPELGTRSIPFSGTLLIDRADFEEDPPKKYNRLKPGGEVLVRRAIGNAGGILKKAGGKQLEGEALENYDINSLFYRSVGTVAAAKFDQPTACTVS